MLQPLHLVSVRHVGSVLFGRGTTESGLRTARMLVAATICSAALLPMNARPIQASSFDRGLILIGQSIGQSSQASEADRRREADKWLKQARQALKEGNLDTAKFNLERAEKLNAKFDSMFDRFQDTPEKVRRDLDAAMAKPGAARMPNAGPRPGAVPPSAPATPGAYSGGNSLADKVAGNPPMPQRREAILPESFPTAPVDRIAGLANRGPAETATPPSSPGVAPPGAVRRLTGQPASGAVGSKDESLRLASQARAAMDRGDLSLAHRLAQQANSFNIPESAFGPGESRPGLLLMEIEGQLRRRGGVQSAAGQEPVVNTAAGNASDRKGYPVSQGVYVPEMDRSRVVPAGAQEPASARSGSSGGRGGELYDRGIRALNEQDVESALRYFTEAWQFRDELDLNTRRQLQDKLVLLGSSARTPAAKSGEPTTLEEVASQNQLLRTKLFREVSGEQAAARKLAEQDPDAALEKLQQLRARIGEAELDPVSQKQLLAITERSINELELFISQNRAAIDLDKRNKAILQDVEERREQTWASQNKLAELVEQFNKLMHEGRYAEARVIAKQANELAPDEPVAQNLRWKSDFAMNLAAVQSSKRRKEEGFIDSLQQVDFDATPFGDETNPIRFGDAKTWKQLSDGRRARFGEQGYRLNPAEQEIRKSLRDKEVELKITNQPLAEVISSLIQLTNVNIHLDPEGLAAEGVTTDTPVSLNLNKPVSLQSALNLILEPLHLKYLIKNEVLLITSSETRIANVYSRAYYVADLVTPIPNFLPDFNVGLPHAIQEAHRALGYGLGGPQWYAGGVPTAAGDATGAESASKHVLAQMMSSSSASQLKGASIKLPRASSSGPGGMGGASLAQFDQLITLITETIEPDSWTDAGGSGTISQFDTNLSLVISQTQDVHDQIADLLEQLRRLQDLQVTIEVRFLQLSDRFFERMGLDFDFNIEENAPVRRAGQDNGPTTIVGLNPDGSFTQSGDIEFDQDSFGFGIPPFGGFTGQAASLGFAILSDIEVFFVLSATQGDQRTNVLQAPKVTLFNGQLATVFDGSQRPFVTGLIPVVGDFAVAHQPVVAVVQQGTSLSVQAVVSSDRRFVRLTLVPYFSQIGNVETFTFAGRRTSDTGTNVVDPAGNPTGDRDNESLTTEGTTVQLPTVSSTTISTTVSVPDGGTILLGGIKRLSEGRNEAGVPMLSKLPYINRLFRNVGIGRDTTSLMMMVTPRIIIQEEEEEKFGIKAAQ